MHVKRPFHVIVKHTIATETSGDYQPGNTGLLCGPSTHRTEIFYRKTLFLTFRFRNNRMLLKTCSWIHTHTHSADTGRVLYSRFSLRSRIRLCEIVLQFYQPAKIVAHRVTSLHGCRHASSHLTCMCDWSLNELLYIHCNIGHV